MAELLPLTVNRDALPPEVLELREQVDLLPWSLRSKLMPLCERACQFVLLQSRLIRIAQEALDQLHLDVRYLMFDVEATRRERDALREELEN